MILGPACSVATEIMGEVAQRFMNITQVWYTTSPVTQYIPSVKLVSSLISDNHYAVSTSTVIISLCKHPMGVEQLSLERLDRNKIYID